MDSVVDALPLILVGAFEMLLAFSYGAYLLRKNRTESETE